MDPNTVHQRHEEFHIIDVRDDEEFAAGHIAGARHIPLSKLAACLGEIGHDLSAVTVCRSGRRSGVAAAQLTKAGLTAHNMEGGMAKWAKKGLPFAASDGSPGRVA